MNESFEKQIGLDFLLTFLAMKKVRDKYYFPKFYFNYNFTLNANFILESMNQPCPSF
jgi:hypothetical protein